MPLPKNQRGVYGNPRADYEQARGALAGFTGLGDEPSVVDPQAREAYRASDIAGILSNLLPGKAPIAGGLGALGSLKNLRRITSEQASLDDMRDLFQKYVRSRGEGTTDQKLIAHELLRNIEDDPLARTHMFTDDAGLSAKAAYQLSPREQGTYLPYLVSFEKGLGHEALEDAYQQAKKSWPDKPMYLYSTPHAEDFYERQLSQGWEKSLEDGIPRYQRKAQGGRVEPDKRGGLVQARECSCQHKAEGGTVSHYDLYQGGSVQGNTTWRPMELDGIIGYITE